MSHRRALGLSAGVLFVLCSVLACSGDDGKDGAPGADGQNGTDGEDGAPGAKGEDGAPGRDGTNGTDGLNGRDGSTGSNGAEAFNYSPLQFTPVGFPATDAEKRKIVASSAVTANGATHEIDYRVILRSGDVLGDNTFGRLVDHEGSPIKAEDDSDFIANSSDFTSILQVGQKLFSVTHFESIPGGMYLSELAQDAQGRLRALSTEPIDFSGVRGLWNPCAGSVTPWGTHLGSEEYPLDARSYETAATFAELPTPDDVKSMSRYYGVDGFAEGATIEQVREVFHPYWVGHPVEITVAENGSYDVTKHYSMGRMAIELAKVMPDEKTAYISDDGENVGFYMYVADRAGELSAGTLYAMKWLQTGLTPTGGGLADIQWIELGHASDAEIEALLDDGIEFSDIFTATAPEVDGSCLTGTLSIAEKRFECLTVNEGMEQAAAFLETRRYAALLGATVELNKEEGIALDADNHTLFVAISDQAKGMLDAEPTFDKGGPNDIKLPKNSCGVVYALDLVPDAVIGSEYVAANFRALVEGTPTTYAVGTPYAGNTCSVNGIANPDNLGYAPEYSTLLIGEDTFPGHQNDALWAYDTVTRKRTRILTTPYGAETTSVYWYSNINGFAYAPAVVQHPYGESDQIKLEDVPASEAHAYVGYLGPIPAAP